MGNFATQMRGRSHRRIHHHSDRIAIRASRDFMGFMSKPKKRRFKPLGPLTSGVRYERETVSAKTWDILWAALVAWEIRNGYVPVPSVWRNDRGARLQQGGSL